MSSELKPCPFCGGGGEIMNTHTASFWVRCQGCRAEAHGKYFDGPGRKNRFVYSEKPKGPFEVDYAGLHPEYKAAFNSACEAWNTRVPAPVPTSGAVEGQQPFERYPKLARWFQEMATNGSALSVARWSRFLCDVNEVINALESRIASLEGSVPTPPAADGKLLATKTDLQCAAKVAYAIAKKNQGTNISLDEHEVSTIIANHRTGYLLEAAKRCQKEAAAFKKIGSLKKVGGYFNTGRAEGLNQAADICAALAQPASGGGVK